MRPKLSSIKQTRADLGDRSRSTIYDLIARGELDAVKDGRRTLIVTESIDRYLGKLKRVMVRRAQPHKETAATP